MRCRITRTNTDLATGALLTEEVEDEVDEKDDEEEDPAASERTP